jgi:hypothetical protein
MSMHIYSAVRREANDIDPRWQGVRGSLLSLLSLLLLLSSSLTQSLVFTDSATRRRGAVSCESEICSQIGIDLLKMGVSCSICR